MELLWRELITPLLFLLFLDFSGIRTPNLQIEGEHRDHKTLARNTITFDREYSLTSTSGSITVQLTSYLTSLDLTKQVNMFLNQHRQRSWIEAKNGGQPYSDSSPCEVSEYSLLFKYRFTNSSEKREWRFAPGDGRRFGHHRAGSG